MAGGFTANLQVEPQKWESPERWPVIIVLVGQEPNMTTGKRPSAKAVQELSQELTYMGISKVVDELMLSLLEVPEVWSWSFWWEVSEWPPLPWSLHMKIMKSNPGCSLVARDLGVSRAYGSSFARLSYRGWKGFAHANLEGLHVFFGGEKKQTVPQKHNISIKP